MTISQTGPLAKRTKTIESADSAFDQSPPPRDHVTDIKSSAYLATRIVVTDAIPNGCHVSRADELMKATATFPHGSPNVNQIYPMLSIDSFQSIQESNYGKDSSSSVVPLDDSLEVYDDHSPLNDPDSSSLCSAEHSRDFLYYGTDDRDGCFPDQDFNHRTTLGEEKIGSGKDLGGSDCSLEVIRDHDGTTFHRLNLNGQVAPLAQPEFYDDL